MYDHSHPYVLEPPMAFNKSNESMSSTMINPVASTSSAKEVSVNCKQSIGDFLFRPKQPARKGKRNIQRLSFHITSKEYQQAMEEKVKEKMKLEEEK